ncbi:MAG: hydrogenase maturation protease [Ignavibacteriaceae bacterium]
MKPILILGMGNLLLGDDGAGIVAVEKLKEEFCEQEEIKFESTSWGGFRIIDLLKGFNTAIIIDAFKTGSNPPGFIYIMNQNNFSGSARMVSFHDINFATAIEFARKLGLKMPDNIIVYGIEAKEIDTFSETLSPEVEEAVNKCVEEIKRTIIQSYEHCNNSEEIIIDEEQP